MLDGGDGNDDLFGQSGVNTLLGGAGNDKIKGGSGNDAIFGGDGNDTIKGNFGIDTVYFDGPRANYQISVTGGAGTVLDRVGAGGTDQISDIDRIVFSDSAIAFKTDVEALRVYCLYQAALNRVPDGAGVGYWIAARGLEISMHEIALAFIGSPEFKSMYGAAPTNEALVRLFYENTLHRTPDAAGVQYWTDALDRGIIDIAGVLLGFSNSDENWQAVLGQIGGSFDFIPYP